MITDENGEKWPENVSEAVQLMEQERAERRAEEAWNRKAAREGWQRRPGIHDDKDTTPVDRFFAKKAEREGWGPKPESKNLNI